MTSHRIRPLVGADLATLPDACDPCPLGDRPADPGAAWVRGALTRYGFFGLGAYQDDRLLGYLLVTPSSHVPRVNPLARKALLTSAVLLRLHVVDDDARHAVARHLVSAAAARLRRAPGVRGIEATAATTRATCVTPDRELLEAAGFVPGTSRPHMILEVSRTVTWRGGLAAARRRIGRLAVIGPLAPPEPTSRNRP